MIPNLTDKLGAAIKFVVNEDQGMIPFVFGEDIKNDMLEDEVDFVHQTHKLRLTAKFTALTQ